MAEFETNEVLEELRSTLSGTIINAIGPQTAGTADAISETSQQCSQLLNDWVELKVGDLADNILDSVRSEVTRIVTTHLENVGTSPASQELDDLALMHEFLSRAIMGRFDAKQLKMLQSLLYEWTDEED